MEYTEYRMAMLHHPERLKDVHPKLVAFLKLAVSRSVLDICVVTGARDAAGVAAKWGEGRTAPGPHAGEPGYPELGQVVTNVQHPNDTAHSLRVTPEGIYATAVDAQFQVGAKLLEGTPGSESELYRWLGELAEAEGLEWGGRFRAVDQAHLQLKEFRQYPPAPDNVA